MREVGVLGWFAVLAIQLIASGCSPTTRANKPPANEPPVALESTETGVDAGAPASEVEAQREERPAPECVLLGKPEGSENTWFTGWSEGWRAAVPAVAVPVLAVSPAAVDTAIEKLETEAAVPLSLAEARTFSEGWSCAEQTFLVRGLYLNESLKSFQGGVEGGTLSIEHRTLGSGPRRKSVRHPVLACLSEPPRRVCVSTSMAQ